MNEFQENFLRCVRESQSRVVNYECYGNVVEFYDEDGCVVMTCVRQDDGSVAFNFAQGECFSYQTVGAA